MSMTTNIKQCEICGAIIYIEISVNDQIGIPSGEPDKHREWHKTNNQ
jgi:hypothetical protein